MKDKRAPSEGARALFSADLSLLCFHLTSSGFVEKYSIWKKTGPNFFMTRLRILKLRITDCKALLFHGGDSGLLHRIERIHQCTLAIDRIGEIITQVGVDLIDSRPPLEIDIHVCRLLLKELAEVLVPKERVRAVHERRI